LEIGGELIPFLSEGEIEEVKKAKEEAESMILFNSASLLI
jgi:hypothetical protein